MHDQVGESGNGSAGDDSEGGAVDPGGSAGSGGVVSSGCDCAPGNYCREGSTDCFACAELSRLRFGAPERLETLSSSGQPSRFPRIGETTTDLLYNVEGVGIRYTSDSSTSAGNLITQSQPQDSSPLLLAENVTSLPAAQMPFNFAYDRVVGIDPFDPVPHLAIGRMALANGDSATAIREFQVALAAGPVDRVSAHCDLAESHLLAGELEEAKRAAHCGADVIIAQGTEGGGHVGWQATMALVPMIVDAVAPIPVLAAGGIADGRGLAAALKAAGLRDALVAALLVPPGVALLAEPLGPRRVRGDRDDLSRHPATNEHVGVRSGEVSGAPLPGVR